MEEEEGEKKKVAEKQNVHTQMAATHELTNKNKPNIEYIFICIVLKRSKLLDCDFTKFNKHEYFTFSKLYFYKKGAQ